MEEFLRFGGFPSCLLGAYFSYHRNLIYHNSVAGGVLDSPHSCRCGIPQGCPLSMTLIAYWLYPWAAMMRSVRAIPRALADDAMVIAVGPKHEAEFRNAYQATLKYFWLVGARVAPHKSLLFSTNANTREKLRCHVLEITNSTMKVVTHLRHLGAHLSIGQANISATLTDRMRKGIAIANCVDQKPWPFPIKAQVARLLILPLALYGVEASLPNLTTLSTLSSALARLAGPHSTLTSNALVFSLSPYGDLDPLTFKLQRRVTLLRRMIAKHSYAKDLVTEIYDLYKQKHMPAIVCDPETLAERMPAPPPGHGSHEPWHQSHHFSYGAIGHLLTHLHESAASMDHLLVIHQHPGVRVDVLHTPWQHLKPMAGLVASTSRKCLQQPPGHT